MAETVGTLKILIADSDQGFIKSVADRFQALQNFKTSPDSCLCGEELFDKVFSNPYDLIFVEMGFPDMKGLEILSRLAQSAPPLPIIMLTAENDARQAVEVMKQGVLDVLMKDDFLSLDLSRLLRSLLETFQLRRENAELQQINQMKNDFLATISHELRTPLTSIVGLSEILLSGRMGAMEKKHEDSLKKIFSQSQNLVGLINQLLDLRAITQEHPKIKMSQVSLKEIVNRQVEATRVLFDKKEVKLTVKGTDDPLMIMADQDSLKKVVEHLISNALKFTPSGGQVDIEFKMMDDKNVQLTIKDTGHGIPPESLPYVFQKFFHVDQSLTRPYGGMGLGLAYCKEVVTSHKGRIWVESQGIDQGTMVSFIVPKATGEMENLGDEEKNRKSVLWVDDNANMLELVDYGFSSYRNSITLCTARGGVAALANIKMQKPDLIILDIMMANMDGFELIEYLKNDSSTKDIPILIVSGYQEAAKRAVESGANDYFLKPFRISDVVEKIEQLLSSRS